jgi:hypothetical protein
MTQTPTTPGRPFIDAAGASVEMFLDRPEIVFSDDNPSINGRVRLTKDAAWALLKGLADVLGATVVTEGQQQDLGLLARETIAAADEQDSTWGALPSMAMLSAHRDRLRDLHDAFRRAGIISG